MSLVTSPIMLVVPVLPLMLLANAVPLSSSNVPRLLTVPLVATRLSAPIVAVAPLEIFIFF